MNEETRQLIEAAFATGWTATGGGVTVIYENTDAQDGATRWLRFTLKWVSGARRNAGLPITERQRGMVMIQVFTPKGEGTKGNDALVDKVCTILREKQYRNVAQTLTVTTETPQPVTVGVRDDFYQQNVIVLFDADKVFTP